MHPGSSSLATDQPHPGHPAGPALQAAEPAAVHREGGGGVQELQTRRPQPQDQSSPTVSTHIDTHTNTHGYTHTATQTDTNTHTDTHI